MGTRDLCPWAFESPLFYQEHFDSSAAKYNNPKKKKKTYGRCLYCKEELNKHNKKYCNNKCQGKRREFNTFKKIESGDISFSADTFKRFLIYKFGNKCMECGWNKVNPTTKLVPIQLEHIDGDSDNNSLSNIKLLCPNCHSLTPTFGALNKGNTTTNRKEKRNNKRKKESNA